MFQTKLKTEHVKGKKWKLTEPLGYTHEGIFISVPTGFETDFASIGGVLLTVFGRPSGITAEPSVVHDFLYSEQSCYLDLNREEADYVFREAMKKNGVGRMKRYSMWIGVRFFGHSRYRK